MNDLVDLRSHSRRIAYLIEAFPSLTFREDDDALYVVTNVDDIQNLRPYPGISRAIDLEISSDTEQALFDGEIRAMCMAVNQYRRDHGVIETIEL